MIAAWMLFGLLLSTVLAGAAHFTERSVRALEGPGRWPWAAALGLSVLVPAAVHLYLVLGVPGEAATAAAGAAGAGGGSGPEVLSAAGQVLGAEATTVRDLLARAGPYLAGLWGALTLLEAAGEAVGAYLRRRRLQRGRRVRYGGRRISLTPGLGPGVAGLWSPRVVVPEWFSDLSPEERQLVVRHEREHVRAGDPWLAAFARAVVVALPWNPAVRWCARRLALAVEEDCDRRTLGGGGNPVTYGQVLLSAAERRQRSRLVTTLTNTDSHLVRRIRRLMDDGASDGRGALLPTAAAGLLCAVAIAGAAWFGRADAARAGMAVPVPGMEMPPVYECYGIEGLEVPGLAEVRLLGSVDDGQLTVRIQGDRDVGSERWDTGLRMSKSGGGGCQISANQVRLDLSGDWSSETITVRVPPGTTMGLMGGAQDTRWQRLIDVTADSRAWTCRVRENGDVSCTDRSR